MSLEQLHAFYRRIGDDPDLQRALDGVSDEELPERMSDLGAEHGHDFSADEVRAMMEEREEEGGVELSEEELEGVSGGVSTFSYDYMEPTSGFQQLGSNLNALSVDEKAFPGDSF